MGCIVNSRREEKAPGSRESSVHLDSACISVLARHMYRTYIDSSAQLLSLTLMTVLFPCIQLATRSYRQPQGLVPRTQDDGFCFRTPVNTQHKAADQSLPGIHSSSTDTQHRQQTAQFKDCHQIKQILARTAVLRPFLLHWDPCYCRARLKGRSSGPCVFHWTLLTLSSAALMGRVLRGRQPTTTTKTTTTL